MIKWTIYGLCDPRDGIIRYVGITCRPKQRLRDHIYRAQSRERNHPVQRWIRSIISDGSPPVMQYLLDGEGVDSGRDAERMTIAELKAEGFDLLNATAGGADFCTVPAEARKRAGLKLKGRIFTSQHRERISKAKMGCKRPDVSERMRHSGEWTRGKKLKLSDAERERRRKSGKAAAKNLKSWPDMTDDERVVRSAHMKDRMKNVWASRTPDERAELSRRIADSRRRNKAEASGCI